MNQASSIQSLGGTCESITIGHNNSKLPLSHKAIFLKSYRPLFLSEKILDNIDAQAAANKKINRDSKEQKKSSSLLSYASRTASFLMDSMKSGSSRDFLDLSQSLRHSVRKAKTKRSSASLLGAYANLERDARNTQKKDASVKAGEQMSTIIASMVKERQGVENTRRVFNEIDIDNDGVVSMEEFIAAYQKIDTDVSREHLQQLFEEADIDDSGSLSFDEFLKVGATPYLRSPLFSMHLLTHTIFLVLCRLLGCQIFWQTLESRIVIVGVWSKSKPAGNATLERS